MPNAIVLMRVVTRPGDGWGDSASVATAIEAACSPRLVRMASSRRTIDTQIDSLVAGQPALHIVVSPRPTTRGCVPEESLALQGAGFADAHPAVNLHRVKISSSGRTVQPLAEAREAPRVLVGDEGSLAAVPAQQIEFVVPLAAAFPDSLGRFPEFSVAAEFSAGEAFDVAAIPEPALRRLWIGWLGWRLSEPNALEGPSLPPVPLPPVRDARLRRAAALYAAGRSVEAARLVLWGDRAGALSASDSLAAAVIAGTALAALGDAGGARALLAPAIAANPCLSFPPTDGGGYARLLDAVRPAGVRCAPMSNGQVARRLLLPGLVQLATGRKAVAFTGDLVIGALGATALVMEAAARAQFADYERAAEASEARRLYDQANHHRATARRAGAAAAAVVVTLALDAVLQERAVRRRLAGVRPYLGGSGSRLTIFRPARGFTAGLSLGMP